MLMTEKKRCAYCGSYVSVSRLKDAVKWFLMQPRALAAEPSSAEKDGLLEECPCCGFTELDISQPLSEEDRNAIMNGHKELPRVSDDAPKTVKQLFKYATLSYVRRNYNQALLSLLYAYSYYPVDSLSIDKDVRIRQSLEQTSLANLEECHLLNLDIKRRVGHSPFKQYDDFEFEDEERGQAAEFLLQLTREDDRTKKTIRDFEKWISESSYSSNSDARTFKLISGDIKKAGAKTIIINSEEIDKVNDIRVGDLIEFLNEKNRSVCIVRNIDYNISLEKIGKKMKSNTGSALSQILSIEDKLITLEIIEED